jgi:hypothetical protein
MVNSLHFSLNFTLDMTFTFDPGQGILKPSGEYGGSGGTYLVSLLFCNCCLLVKTYHLKSVEVRLFSRPVSLTSSKQQCQFHALTERVLHLIRGIFSADTTL